MKRSTKLLTRVQGPSQPGPAGPGRSALSHWLDPDVGRALFADYARAWVTERPNLRPRTLRLHEGLVRIHLVPGSALSRLRTSSPRESGAGERTTFTTCGIPVTRWSVRPGLAFANSWTGWAPAARTLR